MNEIKSILIDLKDILNEQATKRTLEQDLQLITDELYDLKDRVDDSKDFYAEDTITLNWAIDLVDYLYKIIKECKMEN